jgi:hypothetical protein
MTTYYFHVVAGRKLLDPHGLDLPDEDTALHYGEDLASRFEAPVEVTDVRGKVLARYSPKRCTFMAIYRIFGQRIFEPEAVACMAKAYEDALVALQLSDREDPFTEIVARKIVEISELGERDPHRLRDRALEELRRKD